MLRPDDVAAGALQLVTDGWLAGKVMRVTLANGIDFARFGARKSKL